MSARFLEKLTSLDGLHLINFDPSTVKANPGAIVEYNRLREKYRPDLPIIKDIKNSSSSVIDERWNANAELLNIQCASNNDVVNLGKVRGLPNVDGASCYANATLQCIFNCSTIKEQLMKLPKNHTLRTTLQNYLSVDKNVDVLTVKDFVNKQIYGTTFHQDVCQFITDLFNQTESIRNIVEHNVRYTTTCLNANCTFTSSTVETYIMIPLSVTIAKRSTVTLQKLLDHEFGKRETLSVQCDNCSYTQKSRKSKIISVAPILIIQLKLFELNNKKLIKIEQCPIKGITSAILHIGGYNYKVISAIFHTGTLEGGHYTSMLKQKTSWLWMNDAVVQKKSWPRNAKGAYVFFTKTIIY